MLDACERWERWLAHHLPAALATFQEGARPEDIASLEERLGIDLPEQTRAWFRWRNGQVQRPELRPLFGYELLSMDEVFSAWIDWQTYADMNAEVGDDCDSIPEGAIRELFTTEGWIPLARWPGSFNYIGVDLEPGPQGSVGQVITFGRDELQKVVGGRSLSDFLEFVLDELQSPHAMVRDQSVEYCSLTYGGLVAQMHRLHAAGGFDGRRLCRDE